MFAILGFQIWALFFKIVMIVKIKNCQVILSLVRFDNKKSYNKIIKFNQLVFGTEMPDRSIGSSTLLPVTASKDKDGKTKEENLKLLNGNSLDSLDLVCDCSIFVLNNILFTSYCREAKRKYWRLFLVLCRDQELKLMGRIWKMEMTMNQVKIWVQHSALNLILSILKLESFFWANEQ